MRIENSTLADVDTIFKLYDEGTHYQKSVAKKHWQGFERSLVENEIKEKRQWKIIADEQVVCVFAIAFNDPLIWKEKDNDPAVYIHRIATNPLFRGNSYVKHIITWAKEYARNINKDFIRMDTGSGNERLNNYYISCGFTYLGITTLGDSDGLPAHYRGGSSSLFEIRLK
ncbi:acetyltransferase (GNAT) family protein [Chitinophaga niastensis]|uniref:Acetyltransferase (GNAT) family protein n=1 Tax=Chitinophaga niastensis TaxID=536980 RepID=A0A2P8HDP6_CHINA|nr:GNAT family N-acetyltransferase [Chitinophaga niastensis]PSL44356.1 acetyltransferase (GNAT) family protein [Chitinophaga niastensis]